VSRCRQPRRLRPGAAQRQREGMLLLAAATARRTSRRSVHQRMPGLGVRRTSAAKSPRQLERGQSLPEWSSNFLVGHRILLLLRIRGWSAWCRDSRPIPRVPVRQRRERGHVMLLRRRLRGGRRAARCRRRAGYCHAVLGESRPLVLAGPPHRRKPRCRRRHAALLCS